MLLPGGDNEVGEAIGRLMRTRVRGATALGEAAAAVLDDPGHPLVAGLATDAIAGAQLAHREESPPLVGEEGTTLVH
jgi:hypothetical protein